MSIYVSLLVTLCVLLVIGVGLLVGVYYGKVNKVVVFLFMSISLAYLLVVGELMGNLNIEITDGFNTLRLVLLTLVGCVFYLSENMERERVY